MLPASIHARQHPSRLASGMYDDIDASGSESVNARMPGSVRFSSISIARETSSVKPANRLERGHFITIRDREET